MRRSSRFPALAAFFICTRSVEPARAGANPNPAKFLIVSAPRDGKVAYMRVRRGGALAEMGGGLQDAMQALISSGLVSPQGLAVDQRRGQLLVADPDAQTIYSYPLQAYEAMLSVGPRTVLAKGTEARWVAVDAIGNAFFSDEPRNQILKITHEQALRGDTAPEVVYDGTSLAQVSSPGGLAADSFHTYWVNKLQGSQAGSVLRGAEVLPYRAGSANRPAAASLVATLARNSEKSYGICLALNNVYYTQPESTIFGVKKAGSEVVTVSSRLTNPRGCAWDGDGTVYVADRGANAVYSFAGNMRELGAAQVTKTVDFEDAFGIAVYSGAERKGLALSLGVVLAALQAALAAQAAGACALA